MHHFQCNVKVNDKINTLHLVSQVPVIDKSRIITVITSTNSALWYNISIVTYCEKHRSYLTEVCTRYKVDVVKSFKFGKFDNELHLELLCLFTITEMLIFTILSYFVSLTITERFCSLDMYHYINVLITVMISSQVKFLLCITR